MTDVPSVQHGVTTTPDSGIVTRAANFFLRTLDGLANRIPKDLFVSHPKTARTITVIGLLAAAGIAYKVAQKVYTWAKECIDNMESKGNDE